MTHFDLAAIFLSLFFFIAGTGTGMAGMKSHVMKLEEMAIKQFNESSRFFLIACVFAVFPAFFHTVKAAITLLG